MSKDRRVRFIETHRQVATVAMETTQLVLGQFKNFNFLNEELNKVSPCQK